MVRDLGSNTFVPLARSDKSMFLHRRDRKCTGRLWLVTWLHAMMMNDIASTSQKEQTSFFLVTSSLKKFPKIVMTIEWLVKLDKISDIQEIKLTKRRLLMS